MTDLDKIAQDIETLSRAALTPWPLIGGDMNAQDILPGDTVDWYGRWRYVHDAGDATGGDTFLVFDDETVFTPNSRVLTVHRPGMMAPGPKIQEYGKDRTNG